MVQTKLRRRFSVEEYHRMGEAGILPEDERVELIDGEIVPMSPIGRRHAACVKRTTRLFHIRLAERAVVSVQDPIRLSSGDELQPDIALLRLRADFYEEALPEARGVLLVIEIADSTLSHDRNVKLPLYARAGIPEAWLADLGRRRLEVFREPRDGLYTTHEVHGRDAVVAPPAFPELLIRVAEILG